MAIQPTSRSSTSSNWSGVPNTSTSIATNPLEIEQSLLLSSEEAFNRHVRGHVQLSNDKTLPVADIGAIFFSRLKVVEEDRQSSQVLTDQTMGLADLLLGQLTKEVLEKTKYQKDLRDVHDALHTSKAETTISKLRLKRKNEEHESDKRTLDIALRMLDNTRAELRESRAETEKVKHKLHSAEEDLCSLLKAKKAKN
jgi:hypothetical protein